MVDAVQQCPEQIDLGDPLTEEVMEAIVKLREGRAGGRKVVKGCGGEMMNYILDLFHTVWREQRVPDERRDAHLVPIPKKGDLTQCDSWCGYGGEGLCQVIQVRLQEVAEEILPDSQCGVRADRRCADTCTIFGAH